VAGQLHPDFLRNPSIRQGRVKTVPQAMECYPAELFTAQSLHGLRIDSGFHNDSFEGFAQTMLSSASPFS
jgi:hypothetical protein